MASALSAPYKLLSNKYFVDEVYDATVVHPVVDGSRSVLWRGADVALIDGTVNGIGGMSQRISRVLRKLQSGNIRSYATWVLVGSVLLLFFMGLAGGVR
jgi:NADH-quinone oxidoreductase subunit L